MHGLNGLSPIRRLASTRAGWRGSMRVGDDADAFCDPGSRLGGWPRIGIETVTFQASRPEEFDDPRKSVLSRLLMIGAGGAGIGVGVADLQRAPGDDTGERSAGALGGDHRCLVHEILGEAASAARQRLIAVPLREILVDDRAAPIGVHGQFPCQIAAGDAAEGERVAREVDQSTAGSGDRPDHHRGDGFRQVGGPGTGAGALDGQAQPVAQGFARAVVPDSGGTIGELGFRNGGGFGRKVVAGVGFGHAPMLRCAGTRECWHELDLPWRLANGRLYRS